MRRIEPNENVLTASQILAKYIEERKPPVPLHPTLVGQIAKMLDLDYVEDHSDPITVTTSFGVIQKPSRKYGVHDMPAIFAELDKKVESRLGYLF